MDTMHFRNERIAPAHQRAGSAFTLLELMVVMAIIGILTFIAVPAFKGFGQANLLAAAQRQIQDDLGYARQQAIKQRATVYMVFLAPTNAAQMASFSSQLKSAHDALQAERSGPNFALVESTLRVFTNAYAGFGSSYAFYTEQSVGDQPGVVRPRYLIFGQASAWHTLPSGIIFPPGMLVNLTLAGVQTNLAAKSVPFPLADLPAGLAGGNTAITMPRLNLPVLAFDAQGRLATLDTTGHPVATAKLTDRYIALTPGSALIPRLPNLTASKKPAPYDFATPPDLVETPRGFHTNSIFRVASLTGRARKEAWPVRP